MPIATMTSKGRLIVPKEIRDQLGRKPGDKVELVPTGDNGATLRRRRKLSMHELLGSLPTNGVTATPEQIDKNLGDEILEQGLHR